MQPQQALLTGGSGGLGQAVTRHLLTQGFELTLTFQDLDKLEQLKRQLSAAELARIQFVQINLCQEEHVQRLIAGMPRIDALVHLVGGFSMGKTHEYRFGDWQRDFDLNLNTTFLLCKHSLAKMWPQNYGRIVTIGSQGAVAPVGQLAAYCAAKAAVVALTQAIAEETKGSGITANVVLPSIIDTAQNRAAMGTEQSIHWVQPASLAVVIGFLASAAAGDLRGAAIPVYGNS
jgi:NAD(P)-dependent dehydrogenase (short-subunit alcohol dehydrogenase family)